MRSSSQYSFARVPSVEIPRSSFDRSMTYKTCFDAGKLIPFYVDEALPGDTFSLSTTAFARLATPIVPFMDNVYMDFQFFAVPIRLVWEHFVNMMGEQELPGDSTDYLVPLVELDENESVSVGSIFDYMGVPTGVKGLSFSALWGRAYNLIWNEWYRDENLQDPVLMNKTDSNDSLDNFELLPRNKRHDYFTSCLPWPQKGPGVELPLGDRAPVYGVDGQGMLLQGASGTTLHALHSTAGSGSASKLYGSANWSEDQVANVVTKGLALEEERDSGLYADLEGATAATINSLRQAFQIQRLLERDARGGTRYIELLRSHFGVISPDARLQRPEYLGGGTIPVNIHSVAQTSATGSVTPQGNLAAYGTAAGSRIGFSKSFTEHTLILGLVSVRADLNYQQGLPRMFSRRSRFDFYWPALSHLGEQAVLNKEIYAQGSDGVDPDAGTDADNEVFGYQERWAEYRYGINKITGKLRSTVTGALDSWHLAQKFTSLPKLNDAFIKENPPISRVIAVQNEPQFIFDSLVNLRCARPMPMYSVPGLIDHF